MSEIDMNKIDGKAESSGKVLPYWPLEIRRIFATINEVPLASLGTLIAIVGIALLLSYAASIRALVTDLATLFTAGAYAGGSALLVFFALVYVLFGPAVIARLHNQNTKNAGRLEIYGLNLVTAQFGIFAIFLLVEGWSRAKTALISLSTGGQATSLGASVIDLVFVLFVAIAIVAFIRLLWLSWKREVAAEGRAELFFTVVLIGASPLTLFALIASVAQQFVSDNVWIDGGIFACLFAVFAANGGLAKTGKRHTVLFVVAGVITLSIGAAVSIAATEPIFSKAVATAMGVRSARPVELIVKPDTCNDIRGAALAVGQILQPFDCKDKSASIVKALIAWNIGPRWVLELEIVTTDRSEKIKVPILVDASGILGQNPVAILNHSASNSSKAPVTK